MRDKVYVVGHGKLATRIQQHLPKIAQQLQSPLALVDNWDDQAQVRRELSSVLLPLIG